MNFMDIVYVVLWGVVAVFCYALAHKVHDILYLAGLFFTFMFGWNLADLFIEADLLSGMYGWIYKGVAIVFLVVIVGWYMSIRNKEKE